MTEERLTKYNEMIQKINSMSMETLDELVAKDECPYEPEHLIGVAMGMFHCPVCGEMVVAGLHHGRMRDMDEADIGPSQDIDFD